MTFLVSVALWLPGAVLAPAVLAQDPTETLGVDLEPAGEPTAFCGVLSAEEASAALGVTLTVGSSSDTDCSWDSDFVTSGISLLVARDMGDFELDAQEVFPDGSLVDVSGQQAWYTPEGLALFVDLGDGMMFTIELFGTPADGLDVQAALTGLAVLALPRLAEIPAPTEMPEPSSQGDPVLQALIPAAVGDAEMVVDVYTARDLMSDLDPADPDAASSITDLQTLVAAHGKGIDDVSFANAYFAPRRRRDLFAIAWPAPTWRASRTSWWTGPAACRPATGLPRPSRARPSRWSPTALLPRRIRTRPRTPSTCRCPPRTSTQRVTCCSS